ncbi:putative transcription factor interactor and regulator CCHC(Zn) family [Helianthus anomalus]
MTSHQKKRHKCPRCGKYGHHEKTCKNTVSEDSNQHLPSSKKGRGKNTKAHQS